MVRDVSTPLEMTKKVEAIDPNRLGGSVNRPYQRMTNKRKAYAGAGVDTNLVQPSGSKRWPCHTPSFR